jgi:hypothetical protein
MLPTTGTIRLRGATSTDTNAVSVEIFGTPTNLNLTATIVRTLFALASGTIKLTDGYGHCYSNCGCDANCGCDVNCTCDANGGCICDLCPSPDVPLEMADGSEKPAGEIVVGDLVTAWDEEKRILSPRRITYVKRGENVRMSLLLSNGKSGEFAVNHRFLTISNTWAELRDLKVGDILSTGVSVLGTMLTGPGPVISMLVDELHTYVTLGVVSHNAKCGNL